MYTLDEQLYRIRVQGSGFSVQCSVCKDYQNRRTVYSKDMYTLDKHVYRFSVQGSVFRLYGSGLMVSGLGFRV